MNEAALASSGSQMALMNRASQGSSGNIDVLAKQMIEEYGIQNVQRSINNAAAESLGQQLGSFIDSLGMPQFMKDDAKSAMDDVLGAFKSDTPQNLDQNIQKVLGSGGEASQSAGCSGSACGSAGGGASAGAGGASAGGSAGGSAGAAGGGASAGGAGASAGSDSVMSGTMDMISGAMMDEMKEATAEGANKGGNKSGGGAGNWLALLARALGKTSGEHLKKMVELGEKMGELDSKENPEEFAKIQSEFQAESQIFKMFQEAIGTMVKSIGEGMSSVARKQ